MNAAQTLHQFVLGWLLATFALRSGSIVVAVIGHVFNNLCTIALSLTLEQNGYYQRNALPIVLICLPVAAALTFVYLRFVKSKNDVVATKQELNLTDTLLLVLAIVACGTVWVSSLLI